MITQLHTLLLRCYPKRFRREFGDEMQAVFAEAVRDAAIQGTPTLTRLYLREFSQFPQSVIREHLHERTRHANTLADQSARQDTIIARWILRIAGLIISGFLLFVTFFAAPASAQGIGMLLLFLSLMTTWRWEKTGGLLVISVAVITMLLNAIAMPGYVLMGIALLGSGLMVLPFILFGWFFYRIGSLEQGAKFAQ